MTPPGVTPGALHLSIAQVRAITTVGLRLLLQHVPGDPDVDDITRTRVEIELTRREDRRPKLPTGESL